MPTGSLTIGELVGVFVALNGVADWQQVQEHIWQSRGASSASGRTVLQRWTTVNFEELGWHDCHVHGFRLADINDERGTAELEFDIDYILEWLCRDEATFRFRIAPATLTFHDVFALRVELDYAAPTAGMMPFSIDGIEREPVTYPTGNTAFRWRLPINWPSGEITFESPGFTQILRREPIEHDAQSLPADRRRG